jgi:hypothetical protein
VVADLAGCGDLVQFRCGGVFVDTLGVVRWLVGVFVGLVLAGCAETEAKWSAVAYREAVARDDDEEMGRQLRAAVRERALIGLTRQRVRAQLGKPLRVRRAAGVDEFSAGWIGNTFALGDQNLLEVEYDPATRRVIRAELQR